MFPRLITRYGLATHLALLASLPFVLWPFLSLERLSLTVFCLSGLSAVWLLVEPSMRAGEHLSIARRRVLHDILRDPFFWLSLFLVIVAFVRFLNSGVAQVYVDGEWGVSEPSSTAFPASSGKSGLLPLAVILAIAVLMQGISHGIGLTGRVSFGLTASFVMGLGGLAMAGLAFARIPAFLGAARANFAEGPFWSPFFGPVFGVWLVCALAFGANAEVRKWSAARVPFCVSIAGNAAGLLFFSPPVVASVFLLLALLTAMFCYAFLARTSMGAVARNFVLCVVGFAVPFFAVALIPGDVVFESRVKQADLGDKTLSVPAGEIYAVKSVNFFSLDKGMVDVYGKRSAVLSGVAKQIWKKHPWYGGGAGTFELYASFLLSKGDMRVLSDKRRDWRSWVLSRQVQEEERDGADDSPESKEGGVSVMSLRPRTYAPRCAFNSLWTLLAERGLIGMALAVAVLGFLLAAYFGRLVNAVIFLRGEDDADIVLFACPPIVWVAPLGVALLLVLSFFVPLLDIVPAWLTVAVPLAVSAASFPKRPQTSVISR